MHDSESESDSAFAAGSTADAARAYRARFFRVLDYIDAHLEEPLPVDTLSGVAAFSKHHFHRQFAALFGLGVYEYLQLTRLKRASHQLAFRHERPILDIALASGYDSHEAFSRAFKKRLGQTPSDFRKQPDWPSWRQTLQPLEDVRIKRMTAKTRALDEAVRIVQFEETPVAVLEHRGDPGRVWDSVRRFIAWRKANHLPPHAHATFNIFYDDPRTTPPEAYRLDICVATSRPVAPNDAGVIAKTIPGGRCAVLRHIGSDEELEASARALYGEWLPRSGEEPRDAPLFVQRVRFYPDVPEHEAATDLFLPIN